MSDNKRFHAVSLKPGGTACSAVQEFQDKRFLSAEAPLIPLPDCSNPNQCKCRYKHWDDRRQEDRRSIVRGGIAEQLHAEDDRRNGAERRKD